MTMNVGNVGGFDPTKIYQKLFSKIDSDGNSKIDKTEFKAAVSSMSKSTGSDSDIDAMYSKLDTSGDGSVDEKEMLAALKSMGAAKHAQMQQAGTMPPPPPPDESSDSQSLTDDQKATVDSILSKYDSSNLTKDNVDAINKSIKDAGISFGKSLGDEIESQGFSIKTMMSLSGPPDGSGTKTSGTTEQDKMFSDLLSYLSNSTSSSDSSGISSMFNDLMDSLTSSTNYSASGSSSLFSSATLNSLSRYA